VLITVALEPLSGDDSVMRYEWSKNHGNKKYTKNNCEEIENLPLRKGRATGADHSGT